MVEGDSLSWLKSNKPFRRRLKKIPVILLLGFARKSPTFPRPVFLPAIAVPSTVKKAKAVVHPAEYHLGCSAFLLLFFLCHFLVSYLNNLTFTDQKTFALIIALIMVFQFFSQVIFSPVHQ